MVTESFQQIESFLRNWTSFAERSEYDFVGHMALLCACLDNLRTNMLEVEFDDIQDYFDDSQKAFLKKLAKTI